MRIGPVESRLVAELGRRYSYFRLYLHIQTSSSAARLVGTPCRQLRLAVVYGIQREESNQVKRMNTMPILYNDQKTPANISHMQTKDLINTTQSDSSFLCKNIYSSSLSSSLSLLWSTAITSPFSSASSWAGLDT